MLLAAAVLSATADITSAGTQRIAVRVYDTTSRDPASRNAALTITKGILEQAGIASDWRDCGPETGGCRELRRRGELILRLVPTQVAALEPPAGSIAARRHAHDIGLSLAFAVVEPQSRIGVLATVFFDRVRVVADRAGVDLDSVLGRTIAHEIGHLLLGTMGHSRRGLMREVWIDDELVRNEPGDWVFSATDRKKMSTGLKRLR